MNQLGVGLKACHTTEGYDEALTIYETQLLTAQRLAQGLLGPQSSKIHNMLEKLLSLETQMNHADCYTGLGMHAYALEYYRDVYVKQKATFGVDSERTLFTAFSMGESLLINGLFAEAKPFCRKNLNRSKRVLGRDHSTTFALCQVYARSLFCGAEGTRAELEEALTVLQDVAQRMDRVLGASHPERVSVHHELDAVRKLLGSSQEDQNAVDATLDTKHT
jgi:hypothetical protein